MTNKKKSKKKRENMYTIIAVIAIIALLYLLLDFGVAFGEKDDFDMSEIYHWFLTSGRKSTIHNRKVVYF